MIALSPYPRKNHLLAALSDADWQRWQQQLEWVDMPQSQVLYESGRAMAHAYFPTSAIVSLQSKIENDASREIAIVGNEGMIGVSLFMGGESSPSRAVVQSAGEGFRLTAQMIKGEFNRAGPVMHLLLRYTQTLIVRMAQSAAMAAIKGPHSLEQQLCRWLLLCLDRLQGSEPVMTQELIASLLGERSEGATDSALTQPKSGPKHNGSAHISLLDLKGLETRIQKCYAVVNNECGRLLPMPLAA